MADKTDGQYLIVVLPHEMGMVLKRPNGSNQFYHSWAIGGSLQHMLQWINELERLERTEATRVYLRVIETF